MYHYQVCWSALFIGTQLIHALPLNDDNSCTKTDGPSLGLALMVHKRTLHSKTVLKRRSCVNFYADGLNKIRRNLGDSIRNHPLTVNATSARHIVLGAGSGTTATHSLQKALQLIGLSTTHYVDKPKYAEWAKQIIKILGGQDAPDPPMTEMATSTCLEELRRFDFTSLPTTVDAALDTPVAEVFMDIFFSFPNAQVILTTRPAADWVRSRRKQDKLDGFVPMQEPCGLYIGSGPMVFNSTELELLFDLNNDLVRCLVPKKQLFEIDVWTEPKERMQIMMTELAKFLGVQEFQGKGVPFPNE